jgi:hypothetical protein
MYTEPLRCMKQFMADCRPTRPRSLVPLSRPGGYALRSANSQKPEPLSSPRQALADQTVRDFRSTRRAEANVRYLRIPLKKSEIWRGFSCAAGIEVQ